MKKVATLALALCMTLGSVIGSGAAVLLPENAKTAGGTRITENKIEVKQPYSYAEFDGCNLTGINSVKITAANDMSGGLDGDRILVRADSITGDVIGYVDIDLHTPKTTTVFTGSITKPMSGAHDLYFQSLMAHLNSTCGTKIEKIELSKEKYTKEAYVPVPDSKLRNYHETTWSMTDDLGRKVATYEEAGPVREDKKVGMFYWTWHSSFETSTPFNNSEFAKEHPEVKHDYYDPIWPTSNTSFRWNESIFDYYSGIDYWVYRRHAEMLAAAGVDAIFFDTTNGSSSWRREYEVLFSALHDARETGIDVPKVCFMTAFSAQTYGEYIKEIMKRIYIGAYEDGKWSDLWFYWNGKPLVLAYPEALTPKAGDPYDAALMEEIKNFFTFRRPQPSYTSGQVMEDQWGWLEIYPQHGYTQKADGTYEQATVGVAANHSYATNSITAMNSETVMGRSYTSVLGQDKSEGAYKYGYFFTEQFNRAMEIDPELMFIDGWNEWSAGRNLQWGGVMNAFPDTYDNEGSRDMEPTKGDMKDNYYALLVDAVRKFKGTEKREVAGPEKTVDLTNFATWNDVTPVFYGYGADYDRNYIGFGGVTYENYTSRNAVVESKVSRDSENLYFMARCRKSITAPEGDMWMKLYIDVDRNHATGWEGYDYVINYPAPGKVSALSANGEATEIGTASYNVSGSMLALSVNRELLSASGTVDLEFKWADNVSGDIMNFYSDGSVTPISRFNFVYSEKEEIYLSDSERAVLEGTTAVAAGKTVGYISGKRMHISDADTATEVKNVNGVIYVTNDFAAEALGVRTVYEPEKNMVKLRGEKDIYTVLGTLEARRDGYLVNLTNAAFAENGKIYIPVSLFADLYGYQVRTEGDVAVFGEAVSDEALALAKSLVF